MKKIKVFAPATVANLGCGFDIIGLALDGVGDIVSVRIEEGDGLTIINRSGISLPDDIENNVITPAIRSMVSAYGKKIHVICEIERKILPGSGIGSSAASSAAAVYGLNELLNKPFSQLEMIKFAMQGEKLLCGIEHADNVAPAILGGITLIHGYEPLNLTELPVPENFYVAVAHPKIEVTTKEARAILPENIPVRTAVKQWGNVGGLVAGLYKKDMKLVGHSMKDAVAEPYRKRFIPDFDRLRKDVMEYGALSLNIAGSGPSVFAATDNIERAELVGDIMRDHFRNLKLGCYIYTMKVSGAGARVCQ